MFHGESSLRRSTCCAFLTHTRTHTHTHTHPPTPTHPPTHPPPPTHTHTHRHTRTHMDSLTFSLARLDLLHTRRTRMGRRRGAQVFQGEVPVLPSFLGRQRELCFPRTHAREFVSRSCFSLSHTHAHQNASNNHRPKIPPHPRSRKRPSKNAQRFRLSPGRHIFVNLGIKM